MAQNPYQPKSDELELLLFLADGGDPRDFEMPIKRKLFILSKWEERGWFDCGISLITGWLTEGGKEKARQWR